MGGWWVGLKGGNQQGTGSEGVNTLPSPQCQVLEGQVSSPGVHGHQMGVRDGWGILDTPKLCVEGRIFFFEREDPNLELSSDPQSHHDLQKGKNYLLPSVGKAI